MQLGDRYRDAVLNDVSRPVIDSALLFYRQAYSLAGILHLPRLRSGTLISIAYAKLLAGQVDSARSYYHQAITECQRQYDKEGEAIAWSALGTALPDPDSTTHQEKIAAARQAGRLYREIGRTPDAIRQEEAVASIHLRAGMLDLAESELHEVVKEYAAIHYTNLYHTYDLLTGVYKTKGDWPNQLYYGLEMVRNAEENCPRENLAYYYYILGGFYMDAGMHPEALYYVKKAAQYAAAYSNYKGFYDRLKSVIDELLVEDKPTEALAYCKESIAAAPPPGNDARLYYNMSLGDCYLALGRNDKAQFHYLISLDCLRKELKGYNFSFYTYAFVYTRLGRLYDHLHEYTIAQSYLKKLDTVPPRIIKPAQLRSTELLRFQVDSASGNFVSAIRHYQAYKHIGDSLLSVDKSRQIVEMQTKYETRQNQQSIRLLQSVTALLLIIACLLYSAYRAKQRHNFQLGNLLSEKDWLLKEIHHRVKNNLQLITSLLKTQSHFLEEGSARNALRETLNRVQSMSLIHHKLYTENNLSGIDMRVYIGDLISHLRHSFGDQVCQINFEYQVQPIRMDTAQSIAVGLILTEAVTNSIKYGFPNRFGTIRISLLPAAPNSVELTISDNGIGLPGDFDAGRNRSLGMRMIRMLCKQLGGEPVITGSPGVTITVRFPPGTIVDPSKASRSPHQK
jgi:two-component system, sensor histidine kinase PdtaS